MAIVKKISVDNPQGASEIKDIGADAVNVDYNEEYSVKDKIDELSENVSILSSTVESKLDVEGGSLAATVAGDVTAQISSSNITAEDTAAVIWGKFNALKAEFGTHKNSPLYTQDGVHGIRYYDNKLQVYDTASENWIDVDNGADYPIGGTTGQALVKASGADNDVAWGDALLKNGSVKADKLIIGDYNDEKQDTLFEVGNGDSTNTVSNAFEVTNDGYIRTHNNSTKIAFGVDANNKYGYIKDGESSVIPFGEGDMLKSTYDPNGDGIIPIANGGTGANTVAGARTNLGLGSLATKSSVTLTSDVTGILPITNGGTGNSAGYIRTGQKSETAIGSYATAEGYNTTASADSSHAEGYFTIIGENGYNAHAEGWWSQAYAQSAHAEGFAGVARGQADHAEGNRTATNGSGAHSEGYSSMDATATQGIYSSGKGSHAEGYVLYSTTYIRATGDGAHAEGYGGDLGNSGVLASGKGSHAEGTNTTASGVYSHAEGYLNVASGADAHTEGSHNYSRATDSHTEGYGNSIDNNASYSHAEGANNSIIGLYSHAEGIGNYAKTNQHVQGHYNKELTEASSSGTTGDAMAIGNGYASPKSNCFRVTYAGAVYGLSAFNSSGADYAEFFEWKDGNEKAEDRVGLFVTLDDDKIKLANEGDYILGIISGQPSVVGNGDEDWLGRWQRDEFGRFIWGEVEAENPITKKKVKTKTILPNPDYDPEQKYIERKDRPEWDCVGMLGTLAVRDNGKCEVNGFCQCGDGGIAVPAENGYRVIKRVSDNVIKVIFK